MMVTLAYKPVKNLPPKTFVFEIASISVSVTNLFVLPVLGTVSTSDLYLMLFSEVGQCQYRWKWIGRARKHCRSR